MLTVDYARLQMGRGDLVLDVGTGLGRHSAEAARLGARVIALDLFDLDGLAQVRDTLSGASAGHAVNADTCSLPFADDTFDRTIASEVLEHIPNDEQALREIARVTRPGGTVAVTVPRTGQEIVCWALSRDYHDTPGGHVRIYRKRQLTERHVGAGLEPLGYGFAHALHTPYWWLRGLVGPTKETNPLVRAYRRFLEWDIISGPPIVRRVEAALDPVLGKSIVMYSRKPAHAYPRTPDREIAHAG